MEEIELSEKAKREQAAIRASTQRMRAERIQLEEKVKALELLMERKERYLFHLQKILAEAEAERQEMNTEHQRIREMSPAV